MKIAIIPARGGSERIPRKNIKCFNGKPIIAYSIEVALQSGCFDRVLVSTDDDEIADIATQYGAEIPFKRPGGLASDRVGTLAVIQHALHKVAQFGAPAQFACCIYATAPFLDPDDLKRGLAMLGRADVDFAFSVTSYAYPIQRALRLTPRGRVQMLQPDHPTTRSQDLEPAYHDAGQFYWGRAEAFDKGRPIFSERSMPVMLPRHRVLDIDTPEDWIHAELMQRAHSLQQ